MRDIEFHNHGFYSVGVRSFLELFNVRRFSIYIVLTIETSNENDLCSTEADSWIIINKIKNTIITVLRCESRGLDPLCSGIISKFLGIEDFLIKNGMTLKNTIQPSKQKIITSIV